MGFCIVLLESMSRNNMTEHRGPSMKEILLRLGYRAALVTLSPPDCLVCGWKSKLSTRVNAVMKGRGRRCVASRITCSEPDQMAMNPSTLASPFPRFHSRHTSFPCTFDCTFHKSEAEIRWRTRTVRMEVWEFYRCDRNSASAFLLCSSKHPAV